MTPCCRPSRAADVRGTGRGRAQAYLRQAVLNRIRDEIRKRHRRGHAGAPGLSALPAAGTVAARADHPAGRARALRRGPGPAARGRARVACRPARTRLLVRRAGGTGRQALSRRCSQGRAARPGEVPGGDAAWPVDDAVLADLADAVLEGRPFHWIAARAGERDVTRAPHSASSRRRRIAAMARAPSVSRGGRAARPSPATPCSPGADVGPADGSSPSIGRGSFGDVYRAFDPTLDRPVALKLLRRSAADARAVGSRRRRPADGARASSQRRRRVRGRTPSTAASVCGWSSSTADRSKRS